MTEQGWLLGQRQALRLSSLTTDTDQKHVHSTLQTSKQPPACHPRRLRLYYLLAQVINIKALAPGGKIKNTEKSLL